MSLALCLRRIALRSAWFACLLPVLTALHLHGADTSPPVTHVAIRPIAGSDAISRPLPADGTFTFEKLSPGRYQLVLTSQPVTKQTQGATFGERVNASRAAGGTKHATAKNSIGNIRAVEGDASGEATRAASAPRDPASGMASGKREHRPVPAPTDNDTGSTSGSTSAAATRDDSMPNRISMNVSVGKMAYPMLVDGPPIEIEVGADGRLSGRAEAQPARKPGSGGQRPGKGDSGPPPAGGPQLPTPPG